MSLHQNTYLVFYVNTSEHLSSLLPNHIRTLIQFSVSSYQITYPVFCVIISEEHTSSFLSLHIRIHPVFCVIIPEHLSCFLCPPIRTLTQFSEFSYQNTSPVFCVLIYVRVKINTCSFEPFCVWIISEHLSSFLCHHIRTHIQLSISEHISSFLCHHIRTLIQFSVSTYQNTYPVFCVITSEHLSSFLCHHIRTLIKISVSSHQNTYPVFCVIISGHISSFLCHHIRTHIKFSVSSHQNTYPVFCVNISEHLSSFLCHYIRTLIQFSVSSHQNTYQVFCVITSAHLSSFLCHHIKTHIQSSHSIVSTSKLIFPTRLPFHRLSVTIFIIPKKLNNFLVLVVFKSCLRRITSAICPDTLMTNQKHMYGNADNSPF